jgi:hypothetical protein
MRKQYLTVKYLCIMSFFIFILKYYRIEFHTNYIRRKRPNQISWVRGTFIIVFTCIVWGFPA